MGDLDNNQFQNISNILDYIANDTVAPLGVVNAGYNENKNGHRMNSHKWTDKQRHRILEIDTEDRTIGKDFMRRVKER